MDSYCAVGPVWWDGYNLIVLPRFLETVLRGRQYGHRVTINTPGMPCWIGMSTFRETALESPRLRVSMSAAPKQLWMECPPVVRSDSVSSSSVNVIFLLKALTYSIGIKLLLLSSLKWTHPCAPLPRDTECKWEGRPSFQRDLSLEDTGCLWQRTYYLLISDTVN